ncbi:hypothetical protein PtB15_7B778 [Puccinia triticina]|nr:hypothetical protein PtB15_7B778 [Puccinia triticina]
MGSTMLRLWSRAEVRRRAGRTLQELVLASRTPSSMHSSCVGQQGHQGDGGMAVYVPEMLT